MSDKLTVGSLFAGIGGIELGLERTGHFETVWQVEIDDYATRVLERHWPGVRRWGDVQTFPPDDNWHCDVIVGGPPCQPISNIGKKKGSQDDRWMWGEFLRVIATIKPAVVVAENPVGILSHDRGRTFRSIIQAIASQWDYLEWTVIPADASVFTHHERERLFLVGYQVASGLGQGQRDGWAVSGVFGLFKRGQCGHRDTGRVHRLLPVGVDIQVSDANGDGLQNVYRHEPCGKTADASPAAGGGWPAFPGVCRVAHGVPSRVDRLKCLGNAVVPQVAEFIGHCIWRHHQEHHA